ncbi:MAG: class I tRNA ligase family protein, partial [Planctomycetaceae bacterium]
EAPDEWLYRTAEDGTRLKRETNSMPQWAGSCWYYARFCDPKNNERFIGPEKERYWLPVDLYIGGAEHAVLHLLYARFWHKALFDRGHFTQPEPFQRLVNQGMILGDMEFTIFRGPGRVFATSTGELEQWKAEQARIEPVRLSPEDVEKRGSEFVWKEHPDVSLEARSYKMSKSRGNVINPDDIVTQYGADSLRMYEMFMGPLEQVKPWSMSGVEGVYRFLGRVWRMIVDERSDEVRLSEAVQEIEPTEDQQRILHKTIKAVTEDIEKLSFNTAISRMMEFTNEISRHEPRPKAVLEPFVLLLSPFAPHVAEELWQLLGHDDTLAYESWPQYDERLIAEATVEVPVQVNGKLRAKVHVPADADQETIRRTAEEDATISGHLAGKAVLKAIVVPGRLVNFVVK